MLLDYSRKHSIGKLNQTWIKIVKRLGIFIFIFLESLNWTWTQNILNALTMDQIWTHKSKKWGFGKKKCYCQALGFQQEMFLFYPFVCIWFVKTFFKIKIICIQYFFFLQLVIKSFLITLKIFTLINHNYCAICSFQYPLDNWNLCPYFLSYLGVTVLHSLSIHFPVFFASPAPWIEKVQRNRAEEEVWRNRDHSLLFHTFYFALPFPIKAAGGSKVGTSSEKEGQHLAHCLRCRGPWAGPACLGL